MPDYVVYSTSNTHYQRWQCDLLEYSFVSVKQQGKLICLCSEGENGDLPMRTSNIAEVVPLPSYMKNSVTGDFWGIANKIMSLATWIRDEDIEGTILFLDPDMLFVSRIDLEVEPGAIIAQRWVDAGVADSPIFEKYCAKNTPPVTPENAFMYPYLMHSSDVRKIMERYKALAFDIRKGEVKWESDMFALLIASLEFSLKIDARDDLGVCNNWQGFNDKVSNVVHFPGPFIAKDGEKIWFKQDFTQNTIAAPWQNVPDPNRAASRAEYSALMTIKRLVNKQTLDQHECDFMYWKALTSSSGTENYSPQPGKFIVFDQYPGGFNNIRMSLELAAVFAFLLNRTLVLPPRTSFYLLDGECGFEDFFDLDDLGIETIGFDDYCRHIGVERGTSLDERWQEISARSSVIDWDVIQDLTVIPGSDLTTEYAMKYKANKKVHEFDQDILDSESMFFPKNLLGNYYLCVFADDRLPELSRYVARHIHYKEDLFLEAWNIINELGDGNYAAMHIRRNDFQYKDLFISGEEIYRNISQVLRKGEVLYIATDAEDTSFLSELEENYQVFYYKDLSQKIDRYVDKNLIGCLEQLICTRARVFIGNRLSTLSSYVYRLRGYMDDVLNDNYYDNTMLCTLDGEEANDLAPPSWAGIQTPSWAREFPEVWSYRDDKIFVSIAAYRDPDIGNTIRDILNSADDPDNLVLGVCLQEDEDTLLSFTFKNHANVRLISMNYKDAKGVSYARAKIQQELFQDEKYFLQIDSHSRFAAGWDSYLKIALNSCKVNKPILSTYPNPFVRDDETLAYLKDTKSNGIVYKKFDEAGYLNVIGARVIEGDKPVHGMWIGAGFIFAHGRWVREVPYDEHIYFKGEEDSLHIRSFCHGWDVFIPSRNVVFHDYNDNRMQSATKIRPLHWEDHPGAKTGFDVLESLQSGIGLGESRSLLEFQTHFGLDFEKREIQQWALQGYPRVHYDELTGHRAVKIQLDSKAIMPAAYKAWIFCLFDDDGKEVYRYDFTDEAILSGQKTEIELYFDAEMYEMNLPRALLWPVIDPGEFAPRHEYDIDADLKAGYIRPSDSNSITLNLDFNRDVHELGLLILIFRNPEGQEVHRMLIDDADILNSAEVQNITLPDNVGNISEIQVLPLLRDGQFLLSSVHLI